MRDGSRTLSAANPGKRPGANSTKFRDDTHWKTYLQNEALEVIQQLETEINQ